MSIKQETIWPRILLSSYKYLDRLCEAIDKMVVKQGLASGHWSGREDTLQVCERLIDLTQRKVTLINTKMLIEECLKTMDLSFAKILKQKFIDRTKIEELALNYNAAQRSIFRKINTGLLKFRATLYIKGFSEERLNNMLKDEYWMKSLCNSIDKEDETELSDKAIERAVINKKIKGELYEK